jgi:nucleotide-binding universal stress UspA family protein
MTVLAASINPLQVTPTGVVIALLFLTSIVGVLGWMLRLPKAGESAHSAARAVRSVNSSTRILVPLLSSGVATDRIVALAAQMVRSRNGRAELLSVIEVPFMLPLDARVESDEQLANSQLDQAATIARQIVPAVSKRIVKARHAGPAIVREAELQGVDLILIANIPVRVRGNLQPIDPAVEYVMRNAPCEVLVLSQGHTSISDQEHQEHELLAHASTGVASSST